MRSLWTISQCQLMSYISVIRIPCRISRFLAIPCKLCYQITPCSTPCLNTFRGGKVAMTLALRPDLPSGILSRLIVGDISPIRGRMSPDFQRYIDGMRSVENEGARNRKEANDMLKVFEQVRTLGGNTNELNSLNRTI